MSCDVKAHKAQILTNSSKEVQNKIIGPTRMLFVTDVCVDSRNIWKLSGKKKGAVKLGNKLGTAVSKKVRGTRSCLLFERGRRRKEAALTFDPKLFLGWNLRQRKKERRGKHVVKPTVAVDWKVSPPPPCHQQWNSTVPQPTPWRLPQRLIPQCFPFFYHVPSCLYILLLKIKIKALKSNVQLKTGV